MLNSLIVLIHLFLFSPGAKAAVTAEYLAVPSGGIRFLMLNSIREELEQAKLDILDNANAGHIPIFGVDQIATDLLMNRAVFIKFGIKISSTENEVIKVGDDRAYNLHFGSQYVAVFFHNFPLGESDELVFKLKKRLGSDLDFSFFRSFKNEMYPMAVAAVINSQPCAGKGPTNRLPLEFPAVVSRCIVTALTATRSDLDSKLQLLLHPEQLWMKAREKFQELKQISLQLMNVAKDFSYSNFKLDPETLLDMTCGLVGSMLPDIAIALVTGVGVSKLAETAYEMLSKLTKFKRILETISVARRTGKAVADTKKVFQNIFSGRVTPLLEKISSQAAKYSASAAMGVLSCE